MSGIIGDNTGSGSGQIAAVQGVTKSSSDPAIDTNPDGGIGTVWANTTSGEMFACTNDTAGANVWANVGDGTGDIEPYSFGGVNDGYTHCGAHAPYMNHVDKFAFASGTQNAVDHGDDTNNRAYATGTKTATHGIVWGGQGGTNVVSKIQYASDATHDASTSGMGTMTWSDRFATAGVSSLTHGYTGGWESHTTSLEKHTHATDAIDARATGLWTAGAYSAGCTSADYGWVAGGANGIDEIQKYALAAETVSTTVGDLFSGSGSVRAGQSSREYGYASGSDSPSTDVIQRWSFASGTQNAADVGNLSTSKGWGAGQSSKTYGYFSGGNYGSQTNDIEKWAFASSSTNAEASGDLTVARMGCCGTEN